jgi:hypothetical protein
MGGQSMQRKQWKINGREIGKRITREHATEASTRIREFAFNAKAMANKRKQPKVLLEHRKTLNG